MSVTRRPIVSAQILAGRQPFRNGVFAIGPFASRVSFSSQQRRAFGVVSEIHEDLTRSGELGGLKGRDVCIIGAGLAGLSCALAVAAYEGHAFIYEALPRRGTARDPLASAMPATRDAGHRIGHPSLNFWPWEDIDPITRLPALNWFEASCPDIAEMVAADYNRFRQKEDFGERLQGICFGCSVTEIAESKVKQGKWSVTVDQTTDGDDPWDIDFDIVLVATGFGPEEGAAVPPPSHPVASPGYSVATPSYWDQGNDLIAEISKLPSSPFENYIVSGPGDGGLIEALRLLFRPMRAGGPTENFLQILRGQRLQKEVSEAEYQLSKKLSDYMLHEGGLDSPAVASQKRDKLSLEVWEKYSSIAKNRLTHDFTNGLEDARTAVNKVILVGLRPSPLELGSAPYHRILITAAIGMGWAEYWQVADQSFVQSRAISLPSGAYQSTRYGCNRIRRMHRGTSVKFAVDASPQAQVLDASFFIARHGPHKDGAIRHIFKDKTVIAQFRRQQALYADQDLLKEQHIRLLAEKLGTPNPLNASELAKQTDLLKRYFEKLGLHSTFKDTDRGGEIHVTRLRSAKGPLSDAPLPRSIWDLPVYKSDGPPRFGPDGMP